MANFSTHLTGAATVSAGLALSSYAQGASSPTQTQLLFLVGIAGGLLPDIDSDSSKPVRSFFILLGCATAFLVSFTLIGRFSNTGLLLIWGMTFASVRFGLFKLFTRYTVHRGIWHSGIAALVCSLLLTDIAWLGMHMDPALAWLSGLFLFVGYLTHLILDEMASVDLLGRQIKRSFGTALKPLSLKTPLASLAMIVAALVLLWLAPDLDYLYPHAKILGVDPMALQQGLARGQDWLLAWVKAW